MKPMIPNLSPNKVAWTFTFFGGSPDAETIEAPAFSAAPVQPSMPLTMAALGQPVWVAQIKGGHRMVRRLMDLGIVQGSEITLVSRAAGGSVVVGLQGCRIGLGAGMAHRIMVSTTPIARSEPPASPKIQAEEDNTMSESLHLGDVAIGQSGRVVGYEKGDRAYRAKLLSMGLTPGTEFTVTRQAPMGDPVEVNVRGFKLSLRKGEAAALRVEMIAAQEVVNG